VNLSEGVNVSLQSLLLHHYGEQSPAFWPDRYRRFDSGTGRHYIPKGGESMEKVKLTKAQAEALEGALKFFDGDKDMLVERHATLVLHGTPYPAAYKAIHNLTLQQVCDAVYHGYEVEMTPEEDIKAEYDAHKNIASSGSQFYEGFHRGIRFTLEKLGRLDIIGEVE
jgi:hypothetical protein